MKKLLSLFGLLFMAMNGFAQTQTENYVFSTTCLTADCIKKMETIQYTDGLGRPKQIINVAASPAGKDVVTHIEYDELGRQTKDYLPVPQSGGSTRNVYPKASATNSLPYGGEKIYAEKVIENSPLNRVQQQIQPGTDWESYPITYEYKANTLNEVLKFTTTTESQNGANYVQSLILNGFYPVNKLYKNEVTDEDGNTTSEFKNVQGQTLLVRKRVRNDTNIQALAAPTNMENVDTYYVYNEYNQLAFVITPTASRELRSNPNQTIATPENNAIIKELCYQYRYDNRERLVEKKLPGKGWEYFVYDKQDRLIMMQDANLRTQQKWLFTKYDQFGRVAFTGLTLANDTSRNTEQTNADNIADYVDPGTSINYGNNNVRRTDYHYISYSGIWLNYTVENTYPHFSNISALLSLNYYDKYLTENDNYNPGIDIPIRPDTILGGKTLSDDSNTKGRSTKGLPVASYVNIIDGSQWTKTFLWYDELGRGIGTHTINHLGGSTISYSVLDFTGDPQKTETWHKRINSEVPIHIVEDFEYDDQKRLLKHYHEVVGRTPKELLTENHYNEKDQLDSKKVGSESDANFAIVSPALQQMVYDYNIRSWMTGINLNQNDILRPLDPNKLFSYKIKYNDPVNGIAKHNGNITEIDWNYAQDGYNRYVYSYDGLNRLLRADFKSVDLTQTYDSNYYNEQLSYDLNGNIKTLKRNAKSRVSSEQAIQVDNLKYYYENSSLSNKVWKITDNEPNTANPSGYPGGGAAITYDANGNMLTMPDKGITQNITYNHLNLPQQVVQNGKPVTYTYRADGTKVHKQFVVNGQSIDTDYLDGFVYTTPYTSKMEVALQADQAAETMAAAGQREAFELADKVIIREPQGTTTSSPNFFPTAEGFYDYENSRYIYQYQDHLGNVRLSFTRNLEDGSAEALSSNDYYPFGLNFINVGGRTIPQVYNPSVSFENYKYNGKELQETGMYDYGARFYMPDIGRWGVVDPLAEKDRRWSPYKYAKDNPLMFIDPDGMEEAAAAPPSEETTGGGNPNLEVGYGIHLSAYQGARIDVAYYGDPVGQTANSTSSNKKDDKSNTNSSAIHNAGVEAAGDYSLEQNCCISPTLAFNLAKGFTISAGAAAITIGYVANGIFSSAHEPVWAGKAYGLSGGTFTISDVRIEALTTPVKERMGQPGSYTISFSNDQKYHGKGPIDRMFKSALYQMVLHQTTVKSFNWTPSATDREAFKAEYNRMQTDQVLPYYPEGYMNPRNYNIRQSPGYLYKLQDGY